MLRSNIVDASIDVLPSIKDAPIQEGEAFVGTVAEAIRKIIKV